MTQRKISITPIDAARNHHHPVNCPKCKKGELIREEADIGVGTQYGPWRCDRCGWEEDLEHLALMKDDQAIEDESCNLCDDPECDGMHPG